MAEVERLSGGMANAGGVVRSGDLVYRPAPQNAVVLHAFLRHLANRGFSGPQPIGVDHGREIVTYIPGAVAIPPYPTWAKSDRALVEVGKLLKDLHRAAADFAPPANAGWNTDLADPAGGDLVCHNDVCLENVVFDDGKGGRLARLRFRGARPTDLGRRHGGPVLGTAHRS